MLGDGAKETEAEAPRNDGFHRITNAGRPTLMLLSPIHQYQSAHVDALPGTLRIAGGWGKWEPSPPPP